MENGHFLGQERWSKLCFCLWFWYGDKRMQEEAFNLCEVCSQHVSYGLLWLPSPSLLCFWAKKKTQKTCPASIWNGLGFAVLMSLCAEVWAVPLGAVVGSVRVAERCVDVGGLPNCPQQLLSQHPCEPGGGEGSGELPAWCRW